MAINNFHNYTIDKCGIIRNKDKHIRECINGKALSAGGYCWVEGSDE